jgi:Transposase zinc-binding domain
MKLGNGWAAHVQQCQDCAAFRIAYDYHRNRHCPKCQGQASGDWLCCTAGRTFPIGHDVFTVPQEIGRHPVTTAPNADGV